MNHQGEALYIVTAKVRGLSDLYLSVAVWQDSTG